MNGISYFVVLTFYFLNFIFIFTYSERYQSTGFGPYSLEFKQYGLCSVNQSGTNEYQQNFHLSKKNKKTEIVGNMTFLVPWDDTSSIGVHIFKGDSNAGFIPNFLKVEFKGCKALLILYGDNGKDFLSKMNITSVCPVLQKGVYIQNGYDIKKLFHFTNPMIPKSFFYGRYKIINTFKRKGKVLGCSYVLIDAIPNWQRN